MEDNSEAIRSLLESLEPKAVVLGKVSMKKGGAERAGVNLEYSDEHYGLTQVETVDEMVKRHTAEVQRLKEEVEVREKAAYERGLEEGKAAGHEQGVGEVKEEFEKHIELLLGMAQSAASQTRDYYAAVEERLVTFALEIAKKIVGDAATRYRDVAKRLAGEALKLAVERTKVILKCSPADLETLKAAKGDLMTISEGIREIEVEASTRVAPGGVILETDAGSIDATIQTLIEELHQALLPEHSLGKSTYSGQLDVTKAFEGSSPSFTTPPPKSEDSADIGPPGDSEEEAE